MTEIFCGIDHVLLLADYNEPDKHKHWSKHLIINFEEDMRCFIEDEEVVCKGIFIDANILHTIETKSNHILVYLFDETTDVANEIKEKYLENKTYYVLKQEVIDGIKIIWNENMANRKDDKDIERKYSKTYENIIEACKLDTKRPFIKDERIYKVLDIIEKKEEISEGIIGELAENVFLSQSRLSHLFKEETKISLSSFLVIMKISKTYGYILEGKSITEAAVMAGFNSPSHFATTNKNMFGISAYEIKKDVKIIKIK